jgi:fermentation-respiration switch protein FrsA (DUF1100 family)
MVTDNMHKQLLIFPILIFSLGACKEKVEKSLIESLTEISGYTLANTTNRCQISSSNNTNYFSKGTAVSGTAITVDRIDTELPSAGTVEVYYPRGSSTSLPVLALFPGENVHSSFYSRYAARIAAEGYVVYIPNRCTIFFTQYFLKVSSATGNEVYSLAKTQNADTTSPLYGRLDPEKMAYLGHSLGGVTALYALNGLCQPPFCDAGSSLLNQVKLTVLYGAGLMNQLDPAKIKLDDTGKATPVAFIQGSLDTAFPPKDGQSSYDNYKSSKYLVALEGGNHYNLTDVSSPYGANPEKSSSMISQDASISRISQVTILLLNGYLKSNQTDLNKIQTNTTGIVGISVTSSP